MKEGPKKLQKSLILAIVSLGVVFCLVSSSWAGTWQDIVETLAVSGPIKGSKTKTKLSQKNEVTPAKPINITSDFTRSYRNISQLGLKTNLRPSAFAKQLSRLASADSPLKSKQRWTSATVLNSNSLTRSNSLDYVKRMSNLKSVPSENLKNATGKIRAGNITMFQANSLTGHNHPKALNQHNILSPAKIKPVSLKPKVTNMGKSQLRPTTPFKPIAPPKIPRQQNLRMSTLQSQSSLARIKPLNSDLKTTLAITPKDRIVQAKVIHPLKTPKSNLSNVNISNKLRINNVQTKPLKKIEPKVSANAAQPKLKTQTLSLPIKPRENKIFASSALKNSLSQPVSLKGTLTPFKSNNLSYTKAVISYTDASKLIALKSYTSWDMPIPKSKPKEPPYRHSQAAPVVPVSSQNLPQPKPTNNPSPDNHQHPQIIYLGIIGALICGKRKQSPFDSFERLSLDIKDRLLEQNGVGTTQNNRASPNTMAKRTSAFVHRIFTRLQDATQ